jgi:hypothetical protein
VAPPPLAIRMIRPLRGVIIPDSIFTALAGNVFPETPRRSKSMPTKKLTELFVERVKAAAPGRAEYFDAAFGGPPCWTLLGMLYSLRGLTSPETATISTRCGEQLPACDSTIENSTVATNLPINRTGRSSRLVVQLLRTGQTSGDSCSVAR